MTLILDGRKFSEELEQRLQLEISASLANAGRPPGLAVIRIGDDPASGVYVSNKEKACSRIGVASYGTHLPATTSLDEVIRKIESLNHNNNVDGILLQLPLPIGFDETLLLSIIKPEKDVDGLHSLNLGKLIKGDSAPRSCTPAGIMALLERNDIEIEGKRAVVIGRSILVGKPMALMLQSANATVSVAHSYTKELSLLTKEADLLVVAAGKPQMIGAEHVKDNSVVIDVGIHRVFKNPELGEKSGYKLCGDVRFKEVAPFVHALTPVPGGVGPMTVTMLLVNAVNRWQHHCGLSLTMGDLLP